MAVFTHMVEAAEEHYEKLFGAKVLFRGTVYGGEWVTIEPRYSWAQIHDVKLRVEVSFLRAGGLTIAVIDEPSGRDGPLNHVGLGCTDATFRRIRERARRLKLRMFPDNLGAFKFRDRFGVLWEIQRGMALSHRPPKRLDLKTGRII